VNGEALLNTSTSTLEFVELRLANRVLARNAPFDNFDDPIVEALLAVRSELDRRRERL
jgi:hypothetical protein